MVEKLRKAIEPFYTDVCSVYERRIVNKDGRTDFEMILKYENVPCRLSAKAYLFGEKAASRDGHLVKVAKKAKLFMPPEYTVLPGSRIKVKNCGHEDFYAKSGKMNFYTSHNEVMIELEKNYA